MIKVGILGAAGYTGGELIRLLINHPEVEVVFANSESNAGNKVYDVHEGLLGDTEMEFTSEMPFDKVDVVFFCFGHGKSEAFLKEHSIPANVKIIDLAQDFRIAGTEPYNSVIEGTIASNASVKDGTIASDNSVKEGTIASNASVVGGSATYPTATCHDYVYGLPEIHRAEIAKCMHLANPGCFATCIQEGLLPLAKAGLLTNDIAVNAITGSTGAGQKPGATTHFSWRNNNFSTYKLFSHQHLHEITQTLNELRPEGTPRVIDTLNEGYDAPALSGSAAELASSATESASSAAPVLSGSAAERAISLDFIPYRGDFPRGIFCTSVVSCNALQDKDTIIALYKDFFKDAAFTHYSDKAPDLKQVVNTNKCLVHVDVFGRKIVVTSMIDNLLKGAVGQAVQNMNIMFGINEKSGLNLKASAF